MCRVLVLCVMGDDDIALLHCHALKDDNGQARIKRTRASWVVR